MSTEIDFKKGIQSLVNLTDGNYMDVHMNTVSGLKIFFLRLFKCFTGFKESDYKIATVAEKIDAFARELILPKNLKEVTQQDAIKIASNLNRIKDKINLDKSNYGSQQLEKIHHAHLIFTNLAKFS